jgi:hypothetical protein
VDVPPAGLPDMNRVSEAIVADGLFFPGGVALGKNDEIYVTKCGVCFDDGEVLRINP